MTIAAENVSIKSSDAKEARIDPLKTATGVYVTVHGHFYQPPRENPYLEAVERQAGAYPFHDWNERIYYECYRPNAFARILNERGEVIDIVNNFESLSFNIGPTLMSWLEKYDLEVYQKILEADRKSCERLNGHGNAIAQVYNHIIMPLANKRDKYTQIRWGKEDFRSRFGRDPEGIWLAETAVDYPTLKALIDEGIRFTVLAPSQAERCRPFPTKEKPKPQWHEVGGGQIDPTRPYRCYVNTKEYIDIFFYDGPISRDMGFNDVLASSHNFAGRLGQAIRGDRQAQIINVATDGETFGHHKGGTEKCLAFAFTYEFPQRGWTVTNFAHYLSINPPTWEVVLKPVTAWSCSHGVNRWQEDCGCGGGGLWHQKWRRPLRNTLNWLRDRVVEVYENVGPRYFQDHWQTRDEYIKVIHDRSANNIRNFLSAHQCRELAPSEQIDALRLLEMQRHSLLIYTSCAWFFDELSRPEGVQILRYAARVIELARDLAGVDLEPDFIEQIALAPSNVELFGNGEAIYRQLVKSSQVGFEQVAAHYAISTLFDSPSSREGRIYCYDIFHLNYQKQQMGALTLALGQVRLISQITWESANLIFAVLHLGGWDFHCCIKSFSGGTNYKQIEEKLFETLKIGSGAQMVLAMNELFGTHYFNLQHLFAEERHRIIQQVTNETKHRLDQLYAQVYRDNYSILLAFHREGLPVPQELQVAAEVALSNRVIGIMNSLEQFADEPEQLKTYLAELAATAAEADRMNCRVKTLQAKINLERLILRAIWHILRDADPNHLQRDIELVQTTIDVGEQLHLNLSLDRAQELFCHFLYEQIVPNCFEDDSPATACRWDISKMHPLLKLGRRLAVDTSKWLYELENLYPAL